MKKIEFSKVIETFNIKEIKENRYNWNNYDIYYNDEKIIITSFKTNNIILETESLEELVIFLVKMNNKSHKKTEQEEKEQINKTLARIYKKLLYEIKPSINNNEWLKNEKEEYKLLMEPRKTDKTINKMFFESLDDFDKAVNPFLTNDLELYDTENYVEDIEISGYPLDTKKDCCQLNIEDKKTGNSVHYSRRPKEFFYILHYSIEEGSIILIQHNFICKDEFFNKKGEILYISKYSGNRKENYSIDINLTNNTKQDIYNGITPLSNEEKAKAYIELLSGITMAKMITDKMKNNNKVKTRTKN